MRGLGDFLELHTDATRRASGRRRRADTSHTHGLFPSPPASLLRPAPPAQNVSPAERIPILLVFSNVCLGTKVVFLLKCVKHYWMFHLYDIHLDSENKNKNLVIPFMLTGTEYTKLTEDISRPKLSLSAACSQMAID